MEVVIATVAFFGAVALALSAAAEVLVAWRSIGSAERRKSTRSGSDSASPA